MLRKDNYSDALHLHQLKYNVHDRSKSFVMSINKILMIWKLYCWKGSLLFKIIAIIKQPSIMFYITYNIYALKPYKQSLFGSVANSIVYP